MNISVHVKMNEVLSLSTLGNCVGSTEKNLNNLLFTKVLLMSVVRKIVKMAIVSM